MKKAYYADQTITITIPADPARPAEVVFTPGPYADEAKRLAAIPGSGWREALMDCLPEVIAAKVTCDGAKLLLRSDELPSGFLVDRKAVTPKPLRKPRPDASKRMRAYNIAKNSPAPEKRLIMDFKEYKKELMKNPEFAKAYEELQSEMDAIRAALNAKAKQARPQKDEEKK